MANGTITVVNKYKMPKVYRYGSVVYIGRPSVLGNPYKVNNSTEEARNTAVDCHDRWMRNQYSTNPAYRKHIEQLVRELRAGHDVLLQCFCAPKRCHGDNIKALVEGLLEDKADD